MDEAPKVCSLSRSVWSHLFLLAITAAAAISLATVGCSDFFLLGRWSKRRLLIEHQSHSGGAKGGRGNLEDLLEEKERSGECKMFLLLFGFVNKISVTSKGDDECKRQREEATPIKIPPLESRIRA